MALVCASMGYPVAWVVPEFRNGNPLWRMAESAVMPLRNAGLVRTNKSERIIDFRTNGGFLAIYSADNPDSILGEAFKLVIVDEAARVDVDVIEAVIMPTLADHDGDLVLISTPNGINYFSALWQQGQDDGVHVASWRAPSYANPNPNIQRAYALAKERTPDRKFRQEWNAEFIPDGSGVFSGVDEAASAIAQSSAIAGHEYVIGIDWGRSSDYTAIVTYDVTLKAIVSVVRINGMDYSRQRQYVKDVYERFKPRAILAEKNSIGDPIITELQNDGLPVQAFTTTLASKNQLVDEMALALQNGTIQLIPDENLLIELKAFTGKQLSSGLYSYSAPSGYHDDVCMAAMLALHGGKTSDMTLYIFGEENDSTGRATGRTTGTGWSPGRGAFVIESGARNDG